MTEIILIRHGQASFGSDDYDRLSDLGRQQAQWLGQHFAQSELQIDGLVCGDLRRHRETSAGLLTGAGWGFDPMIDARLNEMDYDRLEAAFCAENDCNPPQSFAEFRQMFPAMLRAWAVGNLAGMPEGYREFADRVSEAVDAHIPKSGRIVVISSGGPISVTIGRVLGLDMEGVSEILNMTMNSSVHRFERVDGRLSLMQFNAVPHLDHPDRAHARTFI